jgi:F420-dependent oxidoreductase-like protein
MTEPQQGASYDELLRLARLAEAAGYGAFFRSDHYMRIGEGSPEPGPTDAWVTLGALARETTRIRLGTLVTAATFRLPGPLAVAVATADQMSGGRIEFGLGAGWYAGEHEAYGIPLPPPRERFDRYAEQLEILTGLWSTPAGQTFSHDGTYYTLRESPALPKPAQRPAPPVLIGGLGPTRTPRLAARFATEFNTPFAAREQAGPQFERVAAACEARGRDARSLPCSAALTACVGKDDAQVARRAAAVGRRPDELASGGLAGTPGQVADELGRWAELGASRVYLQILDLADLDHIELIAAEVMPQLS